MVRGNLTETAGRAKTVLRFGRTLALAVAVIPAAVNAQDLGNPSWAAMPDADAMSEAYPAFAAMAGLDGDVTLRCGVASGRTLSLCRVVEASPAALGFDRAGLSLVSLFRANPHTLNGAATPGSVQFTIRFRMGQDPAPLPWTGPEPTPEHLASTREFVEQLESWKRRGDEEIETMNLDVDSDREPRVLLPYPAIMLVSRRAIILSNSPQTPSVPCQAPLVAALEYSVARASKKLACSTPESSDCSHGRGFSLIP